MAGGNVLRCMSGENAVREVWKLSPDSDVSDILPHVEKCLSRVAELMKYVPGQASQINACSAT